MAAGIIKLMRGYKMVDNRDCIDEVKIKKMTKKQKRAADKKRVIAEHKNQKTREELKVLYGVRQRKSISDSDVVAIMSGLVACDCPEEEVLLELWLLDEIEELGLEDEYLYAARVA